MINNFIDARQFEFASFPHPLHEEGTGDSGELYLATSKSNPSEQYIIKSGFDELGCNEFMYHKVASALGLYTQDVKLFNNKQHEHAAAIRFIPNIRKFGYESASAENRAAFFGYEALYIILNETDSREYYLDEDDRVFKLDNAASFKLDLSPLARAINMMAGNLLPPNAVENTESGNYESTRQYYIEKYGQEAGEAYLLTFQRFASLDMSILDEAFAALEKNYPTYVVEYLYNFIQYRILTCKQYIESLSE